MKIKHPKYLGNNNIDIMFMLKKYIEHHHYLGGKNYYKESRKNEIRKHV